METLGGVRQGDSAECKNREWIQGTRNLSECVNAQWRSILRFRGSFEYWSKHSEVGAAVARGCCLTQRMSRGSNQKVISEGLSNYLWLERVCCQMHAVGAGAGSDV